MSRRKPSASNKTSSPWTSNAGPAIFQPSPRAYQQVTKLHPLTQHAHTHTLLFRTNLKHHAIYHIECRDRRREHDLHCVLLQSQKPYGSGES
eukprot:1320486-Amorphochlora_amoeboformis.AAC.1